MNYITDKQIYQMMLYSSYAINDVKKLQCKGYNVLQGNIDDHLVKMDVMLRFVVDSKPDTKATSEIFVTMAELFIKLSTEYSGRFMEETGFQPGCSDIWSEMRERLQKKLADLKKEA